MPNQPVFLPSPLYPNLHFTSPSHSSHTHLLSYRFTHACYTHTHTHTHACMHTHTHTPTHTPSFKWYVPCYEAYQTSDTLYQQLCQGLHGNSIIDLPLFNPRGHIEAQCKICWGLNSFQAMAHVSGNKSMHRQRCT